MSKSCTSLFEPRDVVAEVAPEHAVGAESIISATDKRPRVCEGVVALLEELPSRRTSYTRGAVSRVSVTAAAFGGSSLPHASHVIEDEGRLRKLSRRVPRFAERSAGRKCIWIPRPSWWHRLHVAFISGERRSRSLMGLSGGEKGRARFAGFVDAQGDDALRIPCRQGVEMRSGVSCVDGVEEAGGL